MKQKLFLFALVISLLLALAGCQKAADQPLTVTGVFPADGAQSVPQNAAVEITFSAPPAPLDDFFSISPAVEGSFRYMDNTAAFLPSGRDGNDWEYETTYTVTLKAGLGAKEGKGVLAEDFSFSFTIQKVDFTPYEMSHAWETFLPADYPVLDLALNGKGSGIVGDDEQFAVSVHRLEDGERYLKELYRAILGGAARVDTSALPEVLSFTQAASDIADPENDRYADIVFPETLPEGWYVATVLSDKRPQPVQKLLQVQESAVYAQLGSGQAVLWFNSTRTGQPVPGARLELYKDPYAETFSGLAAQGDQNGIVTMDLPRIDREGETDGWPRGEYSQPAIPYALTGPDGTVYYDVMQPYDLDREKTVAQDYYGFLYLDRPIYHQEDTVKFWGIARPRKDAPKLSQVEVELRYRWDEPPVQTLRVPVSSDGIFTGEVSYQGLRSGSFSVNVYPPDMEREEGSWYENICDGEASISRYKKPVYTGELTTDKLYYRPGETIRAQVEVSLFDRTPAEGMNVMVLSEGDAKRLYTTDSKGLIQAPLTASPNVGDYAGWRPVAYQLQALGDDASDVPLDLQKYVYVFPTTVMLEVEETAQNGRSGIRVTADSIDFDSIPGGGQLIQDYESLRGDPAQAQVTVTLHRVTYDRVEMSPYYDRYTKKSIPRAIYRRNDETVGSTSYTLGADGVLELPDLAPLPEDRDYYYVIVSTETGGHQAVTLTLGDPWVLEPQERTGHFHTFQVSTRYSRQAAYVSYWGTSFDYGETARYQVMDNGIPVEDGTVMTNYFQGGLLEAPRLRGTQGEILCDEEKLPDFTLCGAYFDGTRIYPIKPFSMQVTQESRRLDLQILPGKEDYAPGETAEVTLRLTEDGRPVSGASLCLGVVDEAIFAVQEQYLDLGWDLYRAVFYDYPEVTCSYVQHGADLYYGDGGKGGGGGMGGVTLREKFRDTADFLTGTTGADGTAAFTVKLPDDLTQWRLTAVALDKRAFWGQSQSRLYTTLPFRIDPILSSTYLSGDTIACTVRGFGKEIAPEDMVEYTASIEGAGEPMETSAQAPAGEMIPLTFGKLPAGEYAISVAARCGEYSDGVKVPFTVRDSALVFSIHKEVEVGAGLGEIRPTLYPVELSLYAPGQQSFMNAWNLLRRDSSGRADAALAMEAVRGSANAFFGAGYQHPETDLDGIQITWEEAEPGEGRGGVRLYSYADADPETTAWAAVAAPELLDRYEAADYFTHVGGASATDAQKAAALMGQAALGTLDTLEGRLRTQARNTDLPVLESEYLIAGLSYIDQGEAQRLYAKIIAPKLREERGGLYIKEETAYKTVQSTAGAMACAVLTGAADDAERMMEYLADNSSTPFGTLRGPCQLQAALYLNRFQGKDTEPPTVSYLLGGKRETVVLPRKGCLRLTLGREDFENLDLRAEKGTAIAGVDYVGTPDQLEITDSPRITVTKTMDTPEEEKHLGGETTVTIKVELSPELPYGSYRLVEWVPSNMRLREVRREAGSYFSYRSEEQLLTVDFYHGPWNGRSFTLSYTAASVLDTECVLERTYVYNGETMECGRTEKGEFLPSDYYYLGVGYLFRKE